MNPSAQCSSLAPNECVFVWMAEAGPADLFLKPGLEDVHFFPASPGASRNELDFSHPAGGRAGIEWSGCSVLDMSSQEEDVQCGTTSQAGVSSMYPACYCHPVLLLPAPNRMASNGSQNGRLGCFFTILVSSLQELPSRSMIPSITLGKSPPCSQPQFHLVPCNLMGCGRLQ